MEFRVEGRMGHQTSRVGSEVSRASALGRIMRNYSEGSWGEVWKRADMRAGLVFDSPVVVFHTQIVLSESLGQCPRSQLCLLTRSM